MMMCTYLENKKFPTVVVARKGAPFMNLHAFEPVWDF